MPDVLIPTGEHARRVPTPPSPPAGVSSVWAGREYVSGIPNLFVSRFVQSLPDYIDDVTRDFGADLYDRMLNDSQVYSCLHILKTAVLAEGMELRPKGESKEAKLYSDFCEENAERIDRPFEAFLYEMLDGMAYGNKVAEKVHELEGGKLLLKSLKVKPLGTYAFVTDVYWNVLGLLGLLPGQGSPILSGHVVSRPELMPNLVPREKFCVFTYNPKNGDPRGTSALRPAYTPWWAKMQAWGEYMRYLTQFGSPSLVGTTAENAQAQAQLDAAGNPTGSFRTPETQMMDSLKTLRNGGVIVVPYGATVAPLVPPSTEGVWQGAFDLFDRQIAKAVLGQTLATEEGEHMARAAAEVHQDVLDVVVRHVRLTLARMVSYDVFYHLLLWNFGKDVAEKYTPDVSFGGTGAGDWNADASSVATLVSSGFLAASQYPALDERLGLPRRTPQELRRVDQQQDQAANPPPEAPAPDQPPSPQAGPPAGPDLLRMLQAA